MSKALMKKQIATSALGALLLKSRTTANLSQKEVADHLGYSTAQVVSDWERGIRSPPGPVFKKLIKLYSVSADSFYEAILEERTVILQNKVRKLLYPSKIS